MGRKGYYDYPSSYPPPPPPNRYEADNMRNQARQYGKVPTAPAPSMDITINQGGQGHPNRPGRPGSSPPYYDDYDAYHWKFLDYFPRRENRGMFRLALVEAMLAIVILGGGIWCYTDTPSYCPYYSAIWTSSLYLLNAFLGVIAAKIGTLNLYVTHLVMSLVSIMVAAVSAGLSARNWSSVGTYHHPKIERDEAFCLLGQHDPSRISYIFNHMDRYDFSNCLFQLKVGVAVNSIQFVVAGMEAFLSFISAAMCCKRTCTGCTGTY